MNYKNLTASSSRLKSNANLELRNDSTHTLQNKWVSFKLIKIGCKMSIFFFFSFFLFSLIFHGKECYLPNSLVQVCLGERAFARYRLTCVSQWTLKSEYFMSLIQNTRQIFITYVQSVQQWNLPADFSGHKFRKTTRVWVISQQPILDMKYSSYGIKNWY